MKLRWVLAVLAMTVCANAEDVTPQQELKAAVEVLKAKAINHDKLDWPTVEARAETMIAGAKSAAEAYPAIWYVIRQLGEKHTHLVPPEIMRAVQAGPQAASPYAKLVTEYSGLPTIGHPARGVVLLTVPQFQSTEDRDRAYVAVLRNALIEAKARGICRFIVDLRGNMGGGSGAMMGGVEGLLGAAPHGYWEWPGGARQPWPVMDRPYEGDVSKNALYAEPVAKLEHAAVAVLIDRKTWSASEMTAIAFEGRPRTRFFGEPSGGFVTGNSIFMLPDGAMLAVATGWPADRRGKPYRVAVVPDEETAPGQPTLDAALAWLKAQRCR